MRILVFGLWVKRRTIENAEEIEGNGIPREEYQAGKEKSC
jgi:hypothetical protein